MKTKSTVIVGEGAASAGVLEIQLAAIWNDKIPAMKTALARLHSLGHRRIVLMEQQEGIKPKLGLFEHAFIHELNALGIVTGPYNLPDWGNESVGFHRCLNTLFQHIPPAALILSEARLFITAHLHLTRRKSSHPVMSRWSAMTRTSGSRGARLRFPTSARTADHW